MRKTKKAVISVILCFHSLFPILLMSQSFIQIKDGQFYKNGQPYYYLGTNFWYGMNLGNPTAPELQSRLLRELDHLQQLGIKNLRIMAASEGPNTAPWRMIPALQETPGKYNKALLKGLDFLLAEMSKRDMQAVVCLNNMWPWSGGFAQYMNWITDEPIPYPPPAENGNWLKFMNYSATFFKNDAAQQLYFNHIKTIIERTNSISNIPYKEDATIMSWQLANEPRPILGKRHYRNWIKKTAAFIKALDTNHLISIGSEGNAFLPFSSKFKKEHQIPNIDYATIHIWVQNWGWYSPKNPKKDFDKAVNKAKKYIQRHADIAKKLNMPVVLEEFGMARDAESHAATSSTKYRDQYFAVVFEWIQQLIKEGYPLAGSNFWAWGGEGRPSTPKAIWQSGDDFTGDPPFEYQGWYSVYDTDDSTLAILKKYAKMVSER